MQNAVLCQWSVTVHSFCSNTINTKKKIQSQMNTKINNYGVILQMHLTANGAHIPVINGTLNFSRNINHMSLSNHDTNFTSFLTFFNLILSSFKHPFIHCLPYDLTSVARLMSSGTLHKNNFFYLVWFNRILINQFTETLFVCEFKHFKISAASWSKSNNDSYRN